MKNIPTPSCAALVKCLGMPEFQACILMPGSEPERVPSVSSTPEEAMWCDDTSSWLLCASSVEARFRQVLPLQGGNEVCEAFPEVPRTVLWGSLV